MANQTSTNGYTYKMATDVNYSTKLVAVANGEVWYESASGTMTELADANGAIDSGVNMAAVSGFGKVFIVDGTNKKVVDLVNTKLTVTAMTTAPTRGATLTQATSGATMVVDFVTTAKTAIYGFVTSGTFTATYAVTGGGMTSKTPSAVTASPHWYDWTPYPTIGATSYGTMPTYPNISCMYRGRLVLNDTKNPYMWHMSRQSNPFDWLYGVNDAQSAVAGQDGDVGEIGDIPTAFIPFSDDYMIIGCAHEVDIMRGDPAAGGSLDVLYSADGVFGPMSYCFDGKGNLYFMGTAGLYRIPTGGGVPESLSLSRIPTLMDSIDRTTHRITMGYDRKRNGLIISIYSIAANTSVSYWYDLSTTGIFPETYNVGISAQTFYDSNASGYSHLILGSSDGYLRYFNDASFSDQAANDAAVAITSSVVYGPVAIGQGDKEGILNNTYLSLGTDTTNIDYNIYVNDSAEELIDDLANAGLHSGSFTSGGRKDNIRSRARGSYMALKFGNSTAAKTFAIERVSIEIVPGGRRK
jgi:hypothetical protein